MLLYKFNSYRYSERGGLARAVLAPAHGASAAPGGLGRGGGGGEASAVAAVAAGDPLLHRLLQTVPRRLRIMPRLAAGGGGLNMGGGAT